MLKFNATQRNLFNVFVYTYLQIGNPLRNPPQLLMMQLQEDSEAIISVSVDFYLISLL